MVDLESRMVKAKTAKEKKADAAAGIKGGVSDEDSEDDVE